MAALAAHAGKWAPLGGNGCNWEQWDKHTALTRQTAVITVPAAHHHPHPQTCTHSPTHPHTHTHTHPPTHPHTHTHRHPPTHTHTHTCITCKRLRKSGDACCALGHHRPGYVDRLPLSVTCRQHGLPACATCARMQRGVRNCCARGHHKVHTPVRKRPAAPDTRPAKRLRTARSPARTHMEHARSPHIPATPPAPKRRRPKTPCPPSPPAPRPCEMMGEGEPEHVSRLLFGAEHGRTSTEIT